MSCGSFGGTSFRASNKRHCVSLLVQSGVFKAGTLVMHFHVRLLVLRGRRHVALGGCFVFHVFQNSAKHPLPSRHQEVDCISNTEKLQGAGRCWFAVLDSTLEVSLGALIASMHGD